MKPPIRLITIPELAARRRIFKRSAYRIARELTHATIASRFLVTEESVERYIESKLRVSEVWNATTIVRSSSRTTRVHTIAQTPATRSDGSSRSCLERNQGRHHETPNG